jgi:8-oxo-dGTP pyrophosphatase MutT (NUDIX family)
MPLPPRLLQTAREYADGRRTPVPPRDAATVLLLRDGAQGPEVHVMVRQTSMAFAGGAIAFPGGGVAEADRGVVPGAEWSTRMGCSEADAAAVVAAAVRELAEETGVVVAPADLGLWDAWTTPEFEPRRYRTWFFTAALPEGQEARELSTESSSVTWIRPADALDRVDAGEWLMLPPTYCACLRLATFGSVDEVMTATRTASVEMFTPTLAGDTLTSPAWVEALLEAR